MGNIKLLAERNVNADWANKIIAEENSGTLLFVSRDKYLIAAIVIADEIRDEAQKVINGMLQLYSTLGIDNINYFNSLKYLISTFT